MPEVTDYLKIEEKRADNRIHCEGISCNRPGTNARIDLWISLSEYEFLYLREYTGYAAPIGACKHKYSAAVNTIIIQTNTDFMITNCRIEKCTPNNNNNNNNNTNNNNYYYYYYIIIIIIIFIFYLFFII
jgi:hypothetical protein